jgi:hypothetical protein
MAAEAHTKARAAAFLACFWLSTGQEESIMPTSPYAHLYCYMEYLKTLRPASLLDIGLGNGKLGFIARDLLDVMLGERYRRSDWRLRLDGIEVFGDYIQDHQRAIYDTIHIGDAFEMIDSLGQYDVVVLGDVLEHFAKNKGWLMLDKCFAHAEKAAILFVPLGDGWRQPAIYGNPHETHRACWYAHELQPMSDQHQFFQYKAGGYGAFLIPKAAYAAQRVEMLKSVPFFTLQPEDRHGLRRRYQLDREHIGRIDLSHLGHHAADLEYRPYFLDTQFKEHYRLLSYLSTLFNDHLLFDIGTHKGYSALALSYNPYNRVISYDIRDTKALHQPEKLDRIEFIIGNVLEDPRLLASPLILLDTFHDGKFEQLAYAHLKAKGYKGLLITDDIFLNPAMTRFWQSISENKEDVTDLGHWSGTGIVDFGAVEPGD